jgi:pimeloyl-ACP methyl ester carboxylesterase
MSVLLVHGAWHGAWCWEPVVEHLPGAVAIDLPSDHVEGADFAADVAAVRAALDDMEAPVTLVGHSYGGAVISEAGTHPNVGHLVFLTAFALDAGETILANGAPAAPDVAMTAALRIDGTEVTVDPAGAVAAFYADCTNPPVERLVPHAMAAFSTPVTTPAWRTVPSTYVVCTQDGAIHPDVQRFLATRCTNVVELDASHSPMLSMPDRVAEIVRGATGSG